MSNGKSTGRICEVKNKHIEQVQEKFNEVFKNMKWDDTNRNEKTRKRHCNQGFIAEAVIYDILKNKVGEENVEWNGGKNEPDITLKNEFNIEVKCRNPQTYRNLIIDEGKLNHDDVDFYILCIMNFVDYGSNKGKPISMEIIGYIDKEYVDFNKTPLTMYGTSNEEKYEVQEEEMNDFNEFYEIL